MRERNGTHEILVFKHPIAGIQFVKGGLKSNETCAEAAVRELFEESGLVATSIRHLGNWDSGFKGQTWSFHLMSVHNDHIQDTWQHFTRDGGGQHFSFFWHPLHEPTNENWHEVFIRALAFVVDAMNSRRE